MTLIDIESFFANILEFDTFDARYSRYHKHDEKPSRQDSLKKLKVLPLETWMMHIRYDSLDDWLEESSPIMNRDGWYRIGCYSWFEVHGRAWVRVDEDHKFNLKLKNHVPLSDNARAAIKTLMNERLCPQSLKEDYLFDNTWRTLNKVGRDSLHHTLRMKRQFGPNPKRAKVTQ